jgi:ribose transport system ATP-binding protein
LEARQLIKRFPGVRALHNVRLNLFPGEVLAVIGENGAGKSTLMKILAGVEIPDGGEILLDGTPIRFDSARAALKHGIALIHQELNLSDNLDVAANIYLGREPGRVFINHRQLYADASLILQRVGWDCSPRTLVSSLSIGRQQLVEIAKALSVNARILIMDEPTSSLSQHESEQLFRLIRDLRARQVSVIYISHRLGEVKAIADRVLVLRDGENAGELGKAEIEHERMVRLMVGRDIAQFYQRRSHQLGEPLLEVDGLRTRTHPRHPLSFGVHSGEIVGLAGLVGAGRTEVLRALFGIDRAAGGTIRIHGEPLELQAPLDAIRTGLAMVPEDRKQQGVILDMAIRENLSLPGLPIHRFGRVLLDRKMERASAAESISRLGIKTSSDRQLVNNLSGGNQQKVVLGKWLGLKPRLLLLDEPTRGVDVGAKQEIYRLMEQFAEAGVAILFVSSEMAEILGMADRVLVMHQGRINGELARNELTEEAIMHLATGGSHSAKTLEQPTRPQAQTQQ